MNVTKAIIPCGGFGTRFLPATKVLPKELLPIVDTPTLSYIVDECIDSGITDILIILSPQKMYIKNLFKPNTRLNKQLKAVGNSSAYKLANKRLKAKITFAVQETMNGNGMAVYLGKEFANGEPVAVLFGDDLMYTGNSQPVTKQLIDAYNQTGSSIIGVQKVPEEVARRCGVMIKDNVISDKITQIKGIVEKPKFELPSDLTSLGRFILTYDMFDTIAKTEPTIGGEVYLTDAFNSLIKDGKKVCACEFEARRYDIGNKEGFLEAITEYALRDKHLKDDFKKFLKGIDLD